MTFEVNGHEIDHSSRSYYQGSTHTYTCVNSGCHIRASGEYGALDLIKERAEERNCPARPNHCIECRTAIDPSGKICKYCKVDLSVGTRVVEEA